MLMFARRLFVVATVVTVVGGCAPSGQSLPSTPQIVGAVRAAHPAQSTAPTLLVTVPGTNQLLFVDPKTLTITRVLSVPGAPSVIKMHPTRAAAFINTKNSTELTMVDVLADKVLGVISVPAGFTNFVFSPDGNRIYAVNASGTISVISVVQKTVLTTLNVGATTADIAFSQKFHEIYVSTPDTNAIAVFRSDTFKPEKPIVAGPCPHGQGTERCRPLGITTSADGTYLIAASRWAQIIVINPQDGSRVAFIDNFETNPAHIFYFLTMQPGTDEELAVDDSFSQHVWLVPTLPPFTHLTLVADHSNEFGFAGLAYDSSTGALYAAQTANPPRTGRVVRMPFSFGDPRLVLGETPGGMASYP